MSDKVALVTGAGRRRLGWHVARALAVRGYNLAIHYRTAAAEASQIAAEFQAGGTRALAIQADLTDEGQVRRLMDNVLNSFGRLDVLVNCAGIWKSKRLEDITAADLREHLEVNAIGTFLCVQQAGLAMTTQSEGGCIITVGDWAEIRPYLNYAAYFPSKGAVTALTRCLAIELGSRNPNVRVNCVLPGPVMLPPDLPEPERREAIDGTLVKRPGRPEHIAQAVLFLIENDFVTGVSLPVDGGRTLSVPTAGLP